MLDYIANNESRVKIISTGRQWGKTTLALSEAHKSGNALYVAPSYMMLKKVEKRSNITFMYPKQFTGFEFDPLWKLVVIDEAAFVREDVIAKLDADTRKHNCKFLVLSTPNGKTGQFARLYAKYINREDALTLTLPSNADLHPDVYSEKAYLQEILGQFV